jgi:ADP-heptose:LPS heptosyltransferase
MKMERIAIISLLQPADILMVTPIIENVKRLNPKAYIVLIINNIYAELEPMLNVDRVFLFQRDDILNRLADSKYSLVENYNFVKEHLASLLDEKFDLVINATHNRISGIITSMLDTDTIKGLTFDEYGNKWIDDPWFNYLNDVVLVNNQNTFHFIDILANGAGAFTPFKTMPKVKSPELWDVLNDKLGFSLKDSPYIVFHIDEIENPVVWSMDDYIELMKKLQKNYQDFRIIFTSLKGQVSDQVKFVQLSIPELTALLSRAQLLFSYDFLAVQIGSALNIPVISLSPGMNNFNAWGPYGEGHLVIESKKKEHIKVSTIESAVTYIFNRELFVTPGAFTDECGVLRSRFDKDGFVEYIPLNRSDITINSFYNWIYRSVWKNTISRRVSVGDPRRFISIGEKYIDRMVDIDKEVEYLTHTILNHYSESGTKSCIAQIRKDIRGCGILKEMSFEGQQSAKRFLSTVSVPGRAMDEIKKSSNEVKMVDERIFKLVLDYNFLSPMIGAFKSSREDLHIRNLFPLAKKIIFTYEELFARASFMEEMLDKIIKKYSVPDGGLHG